MAILNPWTTANKQGIPRIETTGVSVGTTVVSYSTNTNELFMQPFNGLVAIKIAQPYPTGTTTTLPVTINNQPIVGWGGIALTITDITAGTNTGILLCWWESSTGTLQLINGL